MRVLWPGLRRTQLIGCWRQGGCFLASEFAGAVKVGGINSGNGWVIVELLQAVPEPSTWAMMLARFTGLGAIATPQAQDHAGVRTAAVEVGDWRRGEFP